MEYPAYLFLITPLAKLDNEAFEQSLGSLLPKLTSSFSHRSVSGTSQTLFKGKDKEASTTYLWRLELELVGGGPTPDPGAAVASLLREIEEELGPNGTVSFVAAVDAEIPALQ